MYDVAVQSDTSPRLDLANVDLLAAEDVLRWGVDNFGDRLAICTAFQAEGMVIVDMARRINPAIRICTIDTGRLHPTTYDFIDRVREHYGVSIEVFFPPAQELEEFVHREGVNAFYRDQALRLRCCRLRKVAPMARVLRGLDAWIAGLRRDQTPTRESVRKVEIDRRHGGIVKLNPLADWSEERVWRYLRAHDVPTHPLYAQGFRTIGCAPCTRAVPAGEDARAGRWWWEDDMPKECGIHHLFARSTPPER